MSHTVPSTCRICTNLCPITVEIENGAVIGVSGDKANSVYQGYSCIKGRAQPSFLTSPERLTRSLRRDRARALRPIAVDDATREIGERLTAIVAEHGPRSVALYMGNGLIACSGTAAPMGSALMDAIGSPMRFTPATIDKPGKPIARALHGSWGAPAQGFHSPDVALLIGINPLITYTGFPNGNPGRWLAEQLARGMELFVVDPRRSDVAKRATVHLAARPGHDAEILAAILRVILTEHLYDTDFVAGHADGLDELRQHVEPFHPDLVAARSGVATDDITRVARSFAGARRGYVMAGTGASMSGPGTLIEYLILNLETLCGHWLRAGDQVPNPGALFPPRRYVAQVAPPRAVHAGEPMRVRGLANTPAGMPTAALADEMLLPGAGQVRALISVGGNPAASFPDQLKTIEALRSLELLVQVDPWMSATAQLADYVIAPTMPLEMASASHMLELMSTLGTGYGTAGPYAQYTPAVTGRPVGSDLIEEWEFFYEVARAMKLPLVIPLGGGGGMPTADFDTGAVLRMDMENRIGTDELISALHADSRIPLDEMKRHPHGAVFADPPAFVEPGDPASTARFQLADTDMMARLDELTRLDVTEDPAFPYRLICRRMMHAYNSSTNFASTNHGRPYNPAFMNPDDLGGLGAVAGDTVMITSAGGSIPGVVHPDPAVPAGLVSMAFGFGGPPEQDADYRQIGSSTARLVNDDLEFDPYSGQPRMSNIPVAVANVAEV